MPDVNGCNTIASILPFLFEYGFNRGAMNYASTYITTLRNIMKPMIFQTFLIKSHLLTTNCDLLQ